MAKQSLKVSTAAFHEIVAAMDKTGIKFDKDKDSLTLTPDIALEPPLDWRLIQVRKDCVVEAGKVYKSRMNDNEIEVTDSVHFVNFVKDIYNYVLNGDTPENKPTETAIDQKTKIKSGWK